MAASVENLATSPFEEEVEPREALIFSQTVDGLLRALGPLSEDAKRAFLKLGLDVTQPLKPAYPVEQWLEMMKLAARLQSPTLSVSEGLYVLGRGFVEGYGETMIGRALLVGMRLIGPRRTLQRFARNLSTGSTFFKSECAQVSESQWSLWINRVTWPSWYVGLIERGLERAGATKVSVAVLKHERVGGPCCLLVSWS